MLDGNIQFKTVGYALKLTILDYIYSTLSCSIDLHMGSDLWYP